MIRPRGVLEAILFVAEEPVPVEELAEVLELPVGTVESELESMAAELSAAGRGITLRKVGAGWRLYSHPESYPYLERFAASATAMRLSNAALEVLAVVAYRQPVSRSQIAEIRGVDSDSAARTLTRLGLIEEKGRLPLPGAPAVYGTTPLLLEKLGVQSLDELPPLADHVPPAGIVERLEETFRTEL